MATSMYQAVNAIRDLFAADNFRYTYDEDDHVFSAGFNLSKTRMGSLRLLIILHEDKRDPSMCTRISAYGLPSTKADESCMAETCEYIARANYGIAIGNFEVDVRDGELRYKVCINVRDGLPGHDALDDLISLPVLMFNRYGDGFLRVIMGVSTPKEAIEKIEG